MSTRTKDITGQVFGSLTAVCPAGKDAKNNVQWEFKCVCGNTHIARGSHVTAAVAKYTDPRSPSCGCIKVKHGLSHHPLYATWVSMIHRCYNPKDASYPSYGAKGVVVCDQWRNDVSSFIQWGLSTGWIPGLHLDKDALSDTQGIQRVYSPTTCQFITSTENTRHAGSRENYRHNSRIKLKPSDIEDIRKLYHQNHTIKQIAEMYNITAPGIRYVLQTSGDLNV